MTTKEALEKIKGLFAKEQKEFKTKDGKLTFKSEVDLADGGTIEAENGDYELENGDTFSVADKKISKFTKAPFTPKVYPIKGEAVKALHCEGELEPGTPVKMKDETGALGELMDGEYPLQEGRSVTVAKGKISKVTPHAAPASANAGEPDADDKYAAQIKALEDGFAAFKTDAEKRIKEANDAAVKVATEFEAFKATNKTFNEKVEEGFKLIGEMPSGEPTNKPKTFFSEARDHSKDRLEKISKAIADLKAN